MAEGKSEDALDIIEREKQEPLIINLVSFGFKQGIPLDADLIFDVRFIPNPFYIDELRPFTGEDSKIKNYVMKWPESRQFLKKLIDMIQFLIPYYVREGKNQLVIGIGCTGGRHRSVAFTDEIAALLKAERNKVFVDHRDIDKDRS